MILFLINLFFITVYIHKICEIQKGSNVVAKKISQKNKIYLHFFFHYFTHHKYKRLYVDNKKQN